MTLRRINTPWEKIAQILGITEAEVMEKVAVILEKFGLKELNKASMEELTRRVRNGGKREVETPRPTPQQHQCLRLYARGHSYDDIAAALGFKNPQTAMNHVSVACKKIGVVNAGRFRLQKVQEYFVKRGEMEAPTPPLMRPQGATPAPGLDDPAFN